MKTIKKRIEKHLKGKKVLLFFVLTNIIYAIMLTVTIPKTMRFSKGMKLLDMMPTGYDSIYINSLFEALGEQGRSFYLYNQIPIDMVYPFLFAISYSLLLAFFLKKLNSMESIWFYLSLLPIVAGLADYLENFGIVNMLLSYPNQSEAVMKFTSVASLLKSMTTSIYFVALLFILGILAIKSIKKRQG